MAGINNNLYPPIFNKSYMPAFVKGTECRIYFSISVYNSLSEMHHSGAQVDGVQVIVQNQKTNQSVLNEDLYPSGIKFTTLNIDSDKEGNDVYYIILTDNDIQGGFNYNQYYKVQIRFTSSEVGNTLPKNENLIGWKADKWLNDNLSCFSEWSTVVLIRSISNPTLILNSFNKQSNLTTFTLSDIIIAGKVNFDIGDQETLKSYRIKIYNQEKNNILQDSGDIYTDLYANNNQIKYKCKYNFEKNANYVLEIQLLTQNLYFSLEEYNFQVDIVNYTIFDANISANPDNLTGRIGIHLYRNSFSTLGTNIIIRRSSSKTNFLIWEDVLTFLIPPNSILDYTWYDYTVENGVWYLYQAQQINKAGFRSTSIQTSKPVMIFSEDILLTTAQNQLKIKFDPQITNFSHTVSQSLTQTIGAKYPFIRRNGNVNYRTFTLSGMITHFMDIRQNLMHSNKEDLYSQSVQQLYQKYNNDNNINAFNDIIQERQFRKKVIDFLYKNDVKLYRSSTEGNILIKLMNISFTPNTTLGRQIYSFTCTAYEIDEFNYDNCVKYNIQDKGAFQYLTNYAFSTIGQIHRPSKDIYYKESGENYENRIFDNRQYFGNSELINNIILDKYKKFTTDILDVSINCLSYLKIELTSNPYLIGVTATGKPYMMTASEKGADAVFLGHIVVINGKDIIIGKDGIYELADEGTRINSLSFVSQYESGTLSYEVKIDEKEKEDNIPKEYSNFTKVGQYWGFFNLNQSIYRKIIDKYNQSYSVLETEIGNKEKILYEQNILGIYGIRIQANPGTTFFIKQMQDSNVEKHIVGATGLLEFYDENTNIQGIYFVGPNLRPAINNNFAEDDEFIETGLVYDTFNQIKNPIKNGVYTITTINKPVEVNQIQIQGLDISAEDLVAIAALADPTSTQTGLKLSDKIVSFLYNHSYFNNLSTSQKQIFTDLIYQEILKQYMNNGNKYIYYEGGWYPFKDNIVQVPSVQAIVDYYCAILRKRF